MLSAKNVSNATNLLFLKLEMFFFLIPLPPFSYSAQFLKPDTQLKNTCNTDFDLSETAKIIKSFLIRLRVWSSAITNTSMYLINQSEEKIFFTN